MKRFYKAVGVEAAGGSFAVLLDGRPVLTPARGRLSLPTRALAEAIAAEWSAQGEAIRLEDMPLNRLAATAIDRMTADREAVVATVAAYARSDLLCYRAAGPAGRGWAGPSRSSRTSSDAGRKCWCRSSRKASAPRARP